MDWILYINMLLCECSIIFSTENSDNDDDDDDNDDDDDDNDDDDEINYKMSLFAMPSFHSVW